MGEREKRGRWEDRNSHEKTKGKTLHHGWRGTTTTDDGLSGLLLPGEKAGMRADRISPVAERSSLYRIAPDSACYPVGPPVKSRRVSTANPAAERQLFRHRTS